MRNVDTGSQERSSAYYIEVCTARNTCTRFNSLTPQLVRKGNKRETMSNKLMEYFKYDHLSGELRTTSKKFAELAEWVDSNLPECAEKTVALRKLLEGKDAAVRSTL